MKSITSKDNPRFKVWKSLLDSRGIKKQGRVLVSGSKIVPELLRHSKSGHAEILLSKELENQKEFEECEVFELSRELYDQLDTLGTKAPLMVIDLPEIRSTKLDEEPQGLEVLCSLSDPTNTGALIRSCLAFDVSRIVLLKESAHPFLPKTTRASSGTNFRAPLAWGPSITEISDHSSLVALSAEGESIENWRWPQSCRLLVGQEGQGLAHLSAKARHISIPMQNGVESLNAAVATSVALYDFIAAQNLKG